MAGVREAMESACTDEALAARIVAGEGDAFDQLVARWRDRIVDLAHLMTGDRDAAEDIGQEAFLRLFRRPQAYDPSRPFAARARAPSRSASGGWTSSSGSTAS